jgi:hypothetical protein
MALVVVACGVGETAAAGTGRACGTKELYGKALHIHVVGEPIPCSRVQRIIRGRCRERSRWSCFSFRPPDPLLVWFKERERFRARWSTAIEARRYPCAEARVTAEAWAEGRRDMSSTFPSREQVLADDLIRCKLLRGMTETDVRALLGPPDDVSSERGRRYLAYEIGLQRDSFFQLDSEYLSLRFDRDGTIESASMYQG